MREVDISQILRIQAQCYPPSMQEDSATILKRIRVAGDTCLVAEDGERVCAYLFAYRSILGKITPLGGVFNPCRSGDTMYLHDLAVGHEWAGRGIGGQLVQDALRQAEKCGLRYTALVAVQDAYSYWRRLGYQRYDSLDAASRKALGHYPGTREYMVRALVT